MNDEPSDMAGTERARLILVQSEQALEDMLIVFDILAKRIRGGEGLSPAELSKSLTAMSQARTKLIDEVKEHEDRGLLSGGRTAEAPLDLESIRTDIGCRLDRIRDALDAERFS